MSEDSADTKRMEDPRIQIKYHGGHYSVFTYFEDGELEESIRVRNIDYAMQMKTIRDRLVGCRGIVGCGIAQELHKSVRIPVPSQLFSLEELNRRYKLRKCVKVFENNRLVAFDFQLF
jgi:hypothetical protein